VIKAFLMGVVVICCGVGVAVNPQILGELSLPAVSLTNTYQLTLISCAAVSMLNLGYFFSALSKIMREFEERTRVSQLHIHGIHGRVEEQRDEHTAT
jgi:uncharacterized protein YacL